MDDTGNERRGLIRKFTAMQGKQPCRGCCWQLLRLVIWSLSVEPIESHLQLLVKEATTGWLDFSFFGRSTSFVRLTPSSLFLTLLLRGLSVVCPNNHYQFSSSLCHSSLSLQVINLLCRLPCLVTIENSPSPSRKSFTPVCVYFQRRHELIG